MDPQDARWQANEFDSLANQLVDKQKIDSPDLIRISSWFDPPFISPRQEAVALPLSLIGMISLFSTVRN